MPFFRKKKRPEKDKHDSSSSEVSIKPNQRVKVLKHVDKGDVNQEKKQKWEPESPTQRLVRMSRLAKPPARRLRSLWDEKCEFLDVQRRDKIKSFLEEDYFLTPEQTELYFRTIHDDRWKGERVCSPVCREKKHQEKMTKQREKWLIEFSAQVAHRLCDYTSRAPNDMMSSNRMRSIADVVLERIAAMLGEPKPSRSCPGRLSRFMVAVADRIAVWIEEMVYKANAMSEEEDVEVKACGDQRANDGRPATPC